MERLAMNNELDKDLQNLFDNVDNNAQEFPVEPFAKQTLQVIQQSDLAFKRLKLCISFLCTLVALIVAPWFLKAVALFSHYTVILLKNDFFIPVFFAILAISYLLSKLLTKLGIVRIF